jgi:hypothetical protein
VLCFLLLGCRGASHAHARCRCRSKPLGSEVVATRRADPESPGSQTRQSSLYIPNGICPTLEGTNFKLIHLFHHRVVVGFTTMGSDVNCAICVMRSVGFNRVIQHGQLMLQLALVLGKLGLTE